jgi:hypothetical protein
MSLSRLIEEAIDKKLRAIPQTLLCTVESFDKTKLTATVKPLYKSVDKKGKEIDYPLLSNLPVMSGYFGNNISIMPTFKKGDLVLVACSTFDNSKQKKKQSAKESEGLFGLENSFVVGGVKPATLTDRDMSVKFEDDKMLLKNKDVSIEISGSKIILKNGSNVSLTLTSSKIELKNPTRSKFLGYAYAYR